MNKKTISFVLVLALICTTALASLQGVVRNDSNVYAAGDDTTVRIGVATVQAIQERSDNPSMMAAVLYETATITAINNTTTIAIKLVESTSLPAPVTGGSVGTVTAYAIGDDGISQVGDKVSSISQTLIGNEQIVELPLLSNPLGVTLFVKPMGYAPSVRIFIGEINWKPEEPATPPPVKPPVVSNVTVKFNANGGKSSKSSSVVKKNSKVGTLPTAKKTDYVFLGWYTSKKGGTKVTSKTVIKSNTTIYAHWGRIAYINVGKGKIKVKKSKSNKSKTIKTIKAGKKITILSTSGKWAKIKTGNKIGYIKKSAAIKQKTTKIKAKKTIMRKSASKKSKKIKTLKKKKKVVVIGSTGKWYKVKAGNKTGYVLKTTVKK